MLKGSCVAGRGKRGHLKKKKLSWPPNFEFPENFLGKSASHSFLQHKISWTQCSIFSKISRIQEISRKLESLLPPWKISCPSFASFWFWKFNFMIFSCYFIWLSSVDIIHTKQTKQAYFNIFSQSRYCIKTFCVIIFYCCLMYMMPPFLIAFLLTLPCVYMITVLIHPIPKCTVPQSIPQISVKLVEYWWSSST